MERKARSNNQSNFIRVCLLILSFSFLIFATGTGCSTTQEEQTVSDMPEGQIQGIKPPEMDFKTKIALFPLENLSETRAALNVVMPLLREKLEEKGISIIDDDSLEKFLLKERIRSTAYISNDMARKIGKELNIKAVFIGTINTYSGGEDPRAGFSARLIDSSDGSILWANHASASGDDFTGILGLGRIKTLEELTSRVLDELLGSFSTVPPYKEKESTYKIAVMPFKNESEIKDAGMIATYMLISELFKSKQFEPIEYGEVRHLVVNFRVRSRGELDLLKTESISESSDVDGILVGTVEYYSEKEATAPPIALISARLIDARTGRILWYDGYQYDGDDGISILDWGRIRSAESVACKVVSKLVKDLRKVEWK